MGDLVVLAERRGEVVGVDGIGNYWYVTVEVGGEVQVRCARMDESIFGLSRQAQEAYRREQHTRLWEAAMRITPGEVLLRCLGGGYFAFQADRIVVAGTSHYDRPGRDHRAKTMPILSRVLDVRDVREAGH